METYELCFPSWINFFDKNEMSAYLFFMHKEPILKQQNGPLKWKRDLWLTRILSVSSSRKKCKNKNDLLVKFMFFIDDNEKNRHKYGPAGSGIGEEDIKKKVMPKLLRRRKIFKHFVKSSSKEIIQEKINYHYKSKKQFNINYILDAISTEEDIVCASSIDFMKYKSNYIIPRKWYRFKLSALEEKKHTLTIAIDVSNDPLDKFPARTLYYENDSLQLTQMVNIPDFHSYLNSHNIFIKKELANRKYLNNKVRHRIFEAYREYSKYKQRFQIFELIICKKKTKSSSTGYNQKACDNIEDGDIIVSAVFNSSKGHNVKSKVQETVQNIFKDLKADFKLEKEIKKQNKVKIHFENTYINPDILADILYRNPEIGLYMNDKSNASKMILQNGRYRGDFTLFSKIRSRSNLKEMKAIIKQEHPTSGGSRPIVTIVISDTNNMYINEFIHKFEVLLSIYQKDVKKIESEYKKYKSDFEVYNYDKCSNIECSGKNKCKKLKCGKCNPVTKRCSKNMSSLQWVKNYNKHSEMNNYSRTCQPSFQPLIVDKSEVKIMREKFYDVKEYPYKSDNYLTCNRSMIDKESPKFIYLMNSGVPCCGQTNMESMRLLKIKKKQILNASYFKNVSNKLDHHTYFEFKFKKSLTEDQFIKFIDLASALNIAVVGIYKTQNNTTAFYKNKSLTNKKYPWVEQNLKNPSELMFITQTAVNKTKILARIFATSDTVADTHIFTQKYSKKLKTATSVIKDMSDHTITNSFQGRIAVYDGEHRTTFFKFLFSKITPITIPKRIKGGKTKLLTSTNKFLARKMRGPLPKNLSRLLALLTFKINKKSTTFYRLGVAPTMPNPFSFLFCLEYAREDKFNNETRYTIINKLKIYIQNRTNKRDPLSLLRPTMIDFSEKSRNSLFNVKNKQVYRDPSMLYFLTSEFYKMNIIIFKKKVNEESVQFGLPYSRNGVLFTPYNKKWKTILIYEHYGLEGKASCELIVSGDNKCALDKNFSKMIYSTYVSSQQGYINNNNINMNISVPISEHFFNGKFKQYFLENGKSPNLVYDESINSSLIYPESLPVSTLPSINNLPYNKTNKGDVIKMIKSIEGKIVEKSKNRIIWKKGVYKFETKFKTYKSNLKKYVNKLNLVKCVVGYVLYAFLEYKEQKKNTNKDVEKIINKFFKTMKKKHKLNEDISSIINSSLPPPQVIYQKNKLNLNNKLFFKDEDKDVFFKRLKYALYQQLNIQHSVLKDYPLASSIPGYYTDVTSFKKHKNERILNQKNTKKEVNDCLDYPLLNYPLKSDWKIVLLV